jgi:hypothetical protein
MRRMSLKKLKLSVGRRGTAKVSRTVLEVRTGMPNEKANEFFSRICAACQAKYAHCAKIKICANQEGGDEIRDIEQDIEDDAKNGKAKLARKRGGEAIGMRDEKSRSIRKLSMETHTMNAQQRRGDHARECHRHNKT